MSYVRRLFPLLGAIAAFAANIMIARFQLLIVLPSMNLSLNQAQLMRDLPPLLASALYAGLNVAVAFLLCRFVDRRPLADFRFGLTPRALVTAIVAAALYGLGFSLMLTALQAQGIFRLYSVHTLNATFITLGLIGFLITGIWEEIVYRGYVFNTLRAYGRGPAYALSILLFAGVHFTQPGDPFSWWRLAGLVTATVTLTYAYEKTGSIWSVALIHGAFDFLSVFFTSNRPQFSLYLVTFQPGQTFNSYLFNILPHLPVIVLVALLYWRYRQAATAKASENVA